MQGPASSQIAVFEGTELDRLSVPGDWTISPGFWFLGETKPTNSKCMCPGGHSASSVCQPPVWDYGPVGSARLRPFIRALVPSNDVGVSNSAPLLRKRRSTSRDRTPRTSSLRVILCRLSHTSYSYRSTAILSNTRLLTPHTQTRTTSSPKSLYAIRQITTRPILLPLSASTLPLIVNNCPPCIAHTLCANPGRQQRPRSK